MTKLTEFDSTNLTTGISNWLSQRRDSLIAGAGGNGAGGGKAMGRHTTRLVANKLYKNWTAYLGSQGRQGTVAEFNGFLCRFWPNMVPELAQSFPNMLPTANCGGAAAQPPQLPAPNAGPQPRLTGPQAATPAATTAPPTQPQPSGFSPSFMGSVGGGMSNADMGLRPRREARKLRGQLIEATPVVAPAAPPAAPAAPPAAAPAADGSGVPNRAQVDQVMVALARMLIDSGQATVGPPDPRRDRGGPGTQPRSAAGQAMAGSRGFGTMSAQRTLQTPVTSDSLYKAMTAARVQVPSQEAARVHALLASKPQGMTVGELANSLHEISPQMMQSLLYAAEYH